MAALQALRAEAAAARRGMEAALAEALAARASITDSADFSEASTTRTASAVDPFVHGRSSPQLITVDDGERQRDSYVSAVHSRTVSITAADTERERDSEASTQHTHLIANGNPVSAAPGGRLPAESGRLEVASVSAGSSRPGSAGRRGFQRGSGSVRSALSMRRSRTESETSAVSGTRVRILDDGLDLPSTVV